MCFMELFGRYGIPHVIIDCATLLLFPPKESQGAGQQLDVT